MESHTYRTFDDLRLNCSTSQPHTQSIFTSLEWFDLLARFTAPDDESVLLATASESGVSCYCLPLLRTPNGLASLSNFYSGVFGPIELGIIDAEFAQRATQELCQQLRRRRPRPAEITISPINTDSRFFANMLTGFAAAGYFADSYFCFGNWFLPCTGISFADYFAQRPSRVRNTVTRARNRLVRAGDWQIRIHTESGAELTAAIDDFERIYQLSWKPEEAYPQFIRELCQLAATRGSLRLGILSLNGTAIASQIWFVENQKALIFKLAYDPDAARYSPGSILTASLMAHVLDQDAVVEVDYLSGDDAYKQEWMTHRRERHGIVAFDWRTLRGLVGLLRHRLGRVVRRLRLSG